MSETVQYLSNSKYLAEEEFDSVANAEGFGPNVVVYDPVSDLAFQREWAHLGEVSREEIKDIQTFHNNLPRIGDRVVLTRDSHGVRKGTRGLVVDAEFPGEDRGDVILALRRAYDSDGEDVSWTNDEDPIHEFFGAPMKPGLPVGRVYVQVGDVKITRRGRR